MKTKERESKMPDRPKILIIVNGGMIQEVYSEVDLDIAIQDADTDDEVTLSYPCNKVNKDDMKKVIETAISEQNEKSKIIMNNPKETR